MLNLLPDLNRSHQQMKMKRLKYILSIVGVLYRPNET